MGAMLDHLDDLIQLEQSVALIEALGEKERKHSLIRLRRSFVTTLGHILQEAGSDPRLNNSSGLASEFHRRFSALRSIVALHQAEWPAVASDIESAEYRASAVKVSAANIEFARWAKHTVETAPYSVGAFIPHPVS